MAETMLTYTVQPGDTLYKIAQFLLGNAARSNDFMTWNPSITDPNKIYAGQKILYPASQAAVGVSAVSPATLTAQYGPQPISSVLAPATQPVAVSTQTAAPKATVIPATTYTSQPSGSLISKLSSNKLALAGVVVGIVGIAAWQMGYFGKR